MSPVILDVPNQGMNPSAQLSLSQSLMQLQHGIRATQK